MNKTKLKQIQSRTYANCFWNG